MQMVNQEALFMAKRGQPHTGKGDIAKRSGWFGTYRGKSGESISQNLISRNLSINSRTGRILPDWLQGDMPHTYDPIFTLLSLNLGVPASTPKLPPWLSYETQEDGERQLRASVSDAVAEAMAETTQELRLLRKRLEAVELQSEAAEDAIEETAFSTLVADAASALHVTNQEISQRSKEIESRLRKLEEANNEYLA